MKLWLGSILVIATPALGVDEDILNSLTDLFENPEPVEERAELMPWTVDTPAPAPFSFLYRDRVIESTDPGTRHLLNFERLPESIRGCRNPHLLHDAEVVLRVTGQIAPLRLGPLIARQSGSVLYEVDGWPDMVFKYQVNCDCLLEDFHPLTRDFAFLKFLKSTGATPQVYISSRGTKFEFSPRTLKTDFRITGEARRKCAESPRSHVRFMMMDKIYGTIWDIARVTEVSVRSSIILLGKMMETLRIIHEMGVVHGDIHSANVGFLDPGRKKIGFIDFGLAFFADTHKDDPPSERHRLEYIHPLHSTYELEGYRASFRDDVFRAVMVAAFFLNGRRFSLHLNSLSDNGEEMLRYKNEEFFFQVPGGPDRFAEYPFESEEDRSEVKGRFQRVLDIVRNLSDINARPPYKEILDELRMALHIFQKA